MADVPLVNNPMTAVADSIIGGTVTGGVAAPTRLKNNWSAAVAPTVNEDSGDGYAIGSRWIDTTADKEYVATDVTVGAAVWKETTAAGGGGAITRSTVGTTSAGASFTTGRLIHMKKVTLAADGFIASIIAQVKGNAANNTAITCAIYADNAGTPSDVIAVGAPIVKESDVLSLANVILSTTVRAVTMPIGYWAAAGDYWLAVCLNAGADSRLLLAFASGTGSDRTQTATSFRDHSVTATATTTNDYSIAADILR